MTFFTIRRTSQALILLGFLASAATAQLQLMRQPPHDPLASSALRTCSADGRVCAEKYDEETSLSLIEASTGRTLRVIPVSAFLGGGALALSSNGAEVAFGGMNPMSTLEVWDSASGLRLFRRGRSMQEASLTWAAIVFGPDHTQLAMVSSSGYAEVWDTVHWRLLNSIEGLPNNTREAQLTASGQFIAYAPDGSARAWDITEAALSDAPAKSLAPVPPPPPPPTVTGDSFPDTYASDFDLSTDDRLFIPGVKARVFDLRSGTLSALPAPETYSGNVDGFDASSPAAIGIWDWTNAVLLNPGTLQPLQKPGGTNRAMAVSPDGKLFAVKRGNNIALINAISGTEQALPVNLSFASLRFSADGAALILEGSETPTHAVSVHDGKELWLPNLRSGSAVSADLHFAAEIRGTGVNFYLRLWDITQRRAVREIRLDAADGPVFSRDGQLLAVPLRSGEIAVLDIASHRRIAVLAGFSAGLIKHIRFTHDNTRLLASTQQGVIRCWDIPSQRELLTLWIDGLDWAAATPDGFYEGTTGEISGFYWVSGTKTVALADQAPSRHLTGLVQRVWQQAAPPQDPPGAGSALSQPQLPTVQATPADIRPAADGAFTFQAKVLHRPKGTLSLRAERNGVPLKSEAVPGDPSTFLVSGQLLPGVNYLVLWAVDSFGRSSAETIIERTIQASSASQPEIVLQLSPPQIDRVVFSPDGARMAVGAGHDFVLWDMRTRRQIRATLDHQNPVMTLGFAADGSHLLTTARLDGVRSWSTTGGAEACRIPSLSDSPLNDTPFATSPESDRVAVADRDAGLIRVFRISDCAELFSLDSGSVAPAWAGKQLLFVAGNSQDDATQIVRFDPESGTSSVLHAPAPIRQVLALHDGRVIALLHDGGLVLEASDALQPLDVGAKSGEKVQRFDVSASGHLLIDFGKREVLFQSDLHTTEATWNNGYLSALALSADDRWVAFVDTLQKLQVYDRAANSLITLPLASGYGPVTQLRFSPAGDVLLTGRGAPTGMSQIDIPGSTRLLFWDLATSTIMRTLGPLQNAGFNSTNLQLDTAMTSIAVTSAAEIESMPFSFTTGRDLSGFLNINNVNVDQQHTTRRAVPLGQTSIVNLGFFGWRVSGSGNIAVTTGKRPGEVTVVDLAADKELARFRPHPIMVRQAALSADGGLLLTFGDGFEEQSVRAWKSDGTPLWRLDGQSSSPHCLAFSDDGSIAAIAADGLITLLDARTGNPLRTFRMEPAEVTALAFSPDNHRLAAGTADGLVHLFSRDSGQPIVTLIAEQEGVLAYTPQMFYTGTLTHSPELSFRLASEVFPLRQFDLYYNRPDLVMQAVAPGMQSLISSYRRVYDKRVKETGAAPQPPDPDALPHLAVDGLIPATVGRSDLTLNLTVSHGPYVPALDHVEVIVNGVPDKPFGLKRRPGFHGTLDLSLSSGTNRVEIDAVDAKGQRSLMQEFVVDNTVHPPRTLYVASVGVSTYSDTAYNLHSAARDAQALANYFTDLKSALPDAKPGPAFDHVIVLDALTDSTATRDHILALRQALSRATVDDTVVLLFAGHGILDNDLSFYFAPYDMDFRSPAAHGLTMSELEGIVASSASRRRLLLVDACHSGEIDTSGALIMKPGSTPRAANSRGNTIVFDPSSVNAFELLRSLFVDLRQSSGTNIVAASAGAEVARESATNGVFTQAVLEGLKQGTAGSGDGHVSVSDLTNFVEQRVRELSDKTQTPTRREQNFEDDFSIQ